MPDGDKFERRLRGRGWAKAYRLAAGNAEWSFLTDSLITAAAGALRGQVECPFLSEIVDVLCSSFAFQAASKSSGGSDKLEAFEELCDNLDDIEARAPNYLGIQLAARSALKVFAEQSRQTNPVATEQILDRLGETFVCDLIDNQWLSPAREGIAEKNNRSVEQQTAWEQKLNDNLKSQARKLFQNVLKADSAKAVRAPKRTAARQTLEILLNEPLVPVDR